MHFRKGLPFLLKWESTFSSITYVCYWSLSKTNKIKWLLPADLTISAKKHRLKKAHSSRVWCKSGSVSFHLSKRIRKHNGDSSSSVIPTSLAASSPFWKRSASTGLCSDGERSLGGSTQVRKNQTFVPLPQKQPNKPHRLNAVGFISVSAFPQCFKLNISKNIKQGKKESIKTWV